MLVRLSLSNNVLTIFAMLINEIIAKETILQTANFLGNYKIIVFKSSTETQEVYPKSCQELHENFQISFGWYYISKDEKTVQKVLCYFERNKVSSLELKHYWPMHHDIKDIFGGMHATGEQVTFTADRESNENSSLYINDDSYVKLPPLNYIVGDFTFCLWVKIRQYFANMRILEFCDTYLVNNILLKVMDNGVLEFIVRQQDLEDQEMIRFGNLNLNEWFHISVTHSNKMLYVYVNGAKMDSKVWKYEFTPYIRKNYELGKGSSISFSDFMIFNRGLDHEEIMAIKELPVKSYAQFVDLGNECGLGTNSVNRIVGGSIALRGDWGWQIALKILPGYFICGGSLITNDWVLTAAHCVNDFSNPRYYTVDVGFHDRYAPDRWSTSKKVSKIIVHPGYNEDNLHNDIALLKLSSSVAMDSVNYKIFPACLSDGQENYFGKIAWATGYGSTEGPDSEASDEVRQVDLPIISDSCCEEKYKQNDLDSSKQICAGKVNAGKDTCTGDSGGPLNVRGNDGRWHLVGITSYGEDCGSGGVYTRVSGYKEWITEAIRTDLE